MPSVSELSDRNLNDVIGAIFEARDKWYEIGLGLRIHVDILEAINADHSTVNRCLREMLTYW